MWYFFASPSARGGWVPIGPVRLIQILLVLYHRILKIVSSIAILLYSSSPIFLAVHPAHGRNVVKFQPRPDLDYFEGTI